MKQIGARQEAGRIGGIGPCGRELCCASWMTSFVSVTTHSARIQDISLNPIKLAGQCGKLKCCLNYELDCYLDALQSFPPTSVPLQTGEGTFYFFKYDIFKNIMWYSPEKDRPQNIVAVDAEHAREIQELNKQGQIPEKLGSSELMQAVTEEMGYNNVVELDDLTRFDDKNKKHKGGNRDNRRGGNDRRDRNNNDRRNNRDNRGGNRDNRNNTPAEQPANNANEQARPSAANNTSPDTFDDAIALLNSSAPAADEAAPQQNNAQQPRRDRNNDRRDNRRFNNRDRRNNRDNRGNNGNQHNSQQQQNSQNEQQNKTNE